eukprot:CAMPEP_0168307158 /NCGR_PEP_ID=MMETSP0142_2-20121227/56728_1 /TAXON_ID=44445 /ORGANISM="Pseudo-nitzschia australis, Strain 10249 10 AB" /LENGTH=446 /DNA_ID=CAMNT_0008259145 /DNA_START=35 /DNA_END=1372 /DNA_ORIENTATION=-
MVEIEVDLEGGLAGPGAWSSYVHDDFGAVEEGGEKKTPGNKTAANGITPTVPITHAQELVSEEIQAKNAIHEWSDHDENSNAFDSLSDMSSSFRQFHNAPEAVTYARKTNDYSDYLMNDESKTRKGTIIEVSPRSPSRRAVEVHDTKDFEGVVDITQDVSINEKITVGSSSVASEEYFYDEESQEFSSTMSSLLGSKKAPGPPSRTDNNSYSSDESELWIDLRNDSGGKRPKKKKMAKSEWEASVAGDDRSYATGKSCDSSLASYDRSVTNKTPLALTPFFNYDRLGEYKVPDELASSKVNFRLVKEQRNAYVRRHLEDSRDATINTFQSIASEGSEFSSESQKVRTRTELRKDLQEQVKARIENANNFEDEQNSFVDDVRKSVLGLGSLKEGDNDEEKERDEEEDDTVTDDDGKEKESDEEDDEDEEQDEKDKKQSESSNKLIAW